jgi:hypothetical protein
LTISSATRKAGPFTGNGATTAFPFTFKIFTAADLLVVLALTSTGVESTLALATHYTVSLNADQNANPGGTLTMLVAPATGYTLTVTSQVANTQSMDLTNAGGFYPSVINTAMDKATIQIQQLAEQVGRAVKVGISSDTTPDALLLAINSGASSATASASSASAAAVAANDSAVAAAASAATITPAAYATAAQGTKADSAAQPGATSIFSASQRTNETTDNDGSFDLNAAMDFKCTPSAGFTLTFTNIPATPVVQKGTIMLVNPSAYSVAAHANTKVGAATLAALSAAGTYELSYRTSNGLVYVTASGALA